MLDSCLTLLQLCRLALNVVATLRCVFLIFLKFVDKRRLFKHDEVVLVLLVEL